MSNPFSKFNPSTVPLQGSNLIEASAGTGKTYSIAILVLRLLLEKQLPIKEILMVTFTKAAVAELEERIRLFVRQAYRVSNNEPIDDTTIKAIVEKSIANQDRQKVKLLLEEAIIFLDEISVLTIHSFCQKTLSEFAFETQQLFGTELLQDTNTLLENEVNKFWRKHITSAPLKFFELMGESLSRQEITELLKNHLSGKFFSGYDASASYTITPQFYELIFTDVGIENGNKESIADAFFAKINSEKESYRLKCEGDTNARKHLLPFIDDNMEVFVKQVLGRRSSKYVNNLFGQLLTDYDILVKTIHDIDIKIHNITNQIFYAAISEIEAGIKNYKIKNNQITFDDLISNLHSSLVVQENLTLVNALQRKYKAVFIDEFQDTDRHQYEIFKSAFGTGTILFYIGDPKQSIYAWRKADIATYFKAYHDVGQKYGMNENYRSAVEYIKAMNVFFKPDQNFDTFHFPAGQQSIQYIPVDSPENNTKGTLIYNGSPVIPISITEQNTNDLIGEAVAAQVVDLLTDTNYSIVKNNITRPVRPSDIGILVRQNKQGTAIKKELAKKGVPAVTIDDAKVLESEEATSLLYLMKAILDTTRSNINRALLTNIAGFASLQVLRLNEDAALELFKKYKDLWNKSGIYSALKTFISDFGIEHKMLSSNLQNGERLLTNVYQIIELLYKIQNTKKLSPTELTDWLKRSIERRGIIGDEYEQRIENDDEAVKIVTIHKSKGLEYNIVFAPFLDLTENNQKFCNYRNEQGQYINLRKADATDEQLELYRQQSEQENRRLIYVAITRAVYKCYVYRNTHYKVSSISQFCDAVNPDNNSLIAPLPALAVPPDHCYRSASELVEPAKPEDVEFRLLQKNWTRMSYSGLAADTEKPMKIRKGNLLTEYDQFVFKQLQNGSTTGNMLHYMFENLHFNSNLKWKSVIESAIKRFSPAKKAEYEPGLFAMITHVLSTRINAGPCCFPLTDVTYDQRIHEFEFDFPVRLFQPEMLQKLTSEFITINTKTRYELEGIMNGKIDMLFLVQGKYFILDWKSNFLGDTLEDYQPSGLNTAMSDNNYHLQYLIYTLATKKYLETRIADFDYDTDFGGVLYLFVRGMRQHSDHGIFYTKPSLELINALDKILS